MVFPDCKAGDSSVKTKDLPGGFQKDVVFRFFFGGFWLRKKQAKNNLLVVLLIIQYEILIFFRSSHLPKMLFKVLLVSAVFRTWLSPSRSSEGVTPNFTISTFEEADGLLVGASIRSNAFGSSLLK